jgi:uncharacterized protein
MKDLEYYSKKIIDALVPSVHPRKIVVFGSFANGTQNEDSDLDLLVVTDDDLDPQSYRDDMHIYLAVCESLAQIKKDVAIDLVVYTAPLYERFKKTDSMFSRELGKTGKVVYERYN